MHIDERYMARALQLARGGWLYASPNPMVGAVIVAPDGKIIGEGYHRRCGEGHAEVNAIASVADKALLRQATMYVTLEPCAHYGRTGPCAKLIIDMGIPRVVVGVRDPFDKVDGKGIEMMRQAGVEVAVGVLEQECRSLNAIFFTAHTQHRPFVCLKWAQSADGYLDCERTTGAPAAKISTPITQVLMHRLRSRFDAIMVGSGTVLADNPMLDNRLWAGRSPQPVILDRRHRVGEESRILQRSPWIASDKSLPQVLSRLYDKGVTSLLVEGGAEVLQSIVDSGLWDIARVETGSCVFGAEGRAAAPLIGHLAPVLSREIDGNTIAFYSQNPIFDVKNL